MIRVLQGVDVIDVEKVRRVAGRNETFAEEVFSAKEREYCLAQAEPFVHLAGRFAAKEACLKALGVGIAAPGAAGALRDIEVARSPSGRPSLALSGWAGRVARTRGVRQSSVSISHAAGVAVAVVVLVAETPAGSER